MADSGTPKPPPYDGHACTKRDHVVSGVKIDPSDERLWKCDCGCTMIGNARVEIRFGLLPHRFPEAEFKCGKSESAATHPESEPIYADPYTRITWLQEEIERLRDRAVCSGCGSDVAESGACLAECGDGEMIPASELPVALRQMREQRDELQAELNDV